MKMNFVRAILLLFLLLSSSTRAAHATPVLVDRVIAVVEDRPIYRSELLVRARPYLLKLGEKRDPKAVREVYRTVTERMIDELLIQAVAKDMKLTVTEEDIERAMKDLAERGNVTRDGLLAEAKKQGLSPEEFHEELKRQLFEAKWIAVKVRPRVRAPEAGTPEEKQQALATLLDVERKRQLSLLRSIAYVEVRW